MGKRIKLFGAMHYSQKVFIKEKRKSDEKEITPHYVGGNR
jgi:hypothetical protein